MRKKLTALILALAMLLALSACNGETPSEEPPASLNVPEAEEPNEPEPTEPTEPSEPEEEPEPEEPAEDETQPVEEEPAPEEPAPEVGYKLVSQDGLVSVMLPHITEMSNNNNIHILYNDNLSTLYILGFEDVFELDFLAESLYSMLEHINIYAPVDTRQIELQKPIAHFECTITEQYYIEETGLATMYGTRIFLSNDQDILITQNFISTSFEHNGYLYGFYYVNPIDSLIEMDIIKENFEDILATIEINA